MPAWLSADLAIQASYFVTAALFILDALDPLTKEALHAAADDLAARLTRLGPDIRAARRLIAAGPTPDEDEGD